MSGFISVVLAFNGSGGWLDLCLVWIGIFGFACLLKLKITRTIHVFSENPGAETETFPKCYKDQLCKAYYSKDQNLYFSILKFPGTKFANFET